jgi:hypothetical protein
VAQTEGTGGQGRWHDSAPITLDSATLSLYGNRAYEVTEKVGVVTAIGGSTFEVRRDAASRTATLELAGLIQAQDVGGKDGNNASIRIITTNNPWGLLGVDERVKVTGGAASMSSYSFKTLLTTPVTITNGMLPPWITSRDEIQFVTYVPELGFVNAGYDRNWAAKTFSTAEGSSTDRANFSGSFVINSGVTMQVYAMLMQGNPGFTSSVPAAGGTATGSDTGTASWTGSWTATGSAGGAMSCCVTVSCTGTASAGAAAGPAICCGWRATGADQRSASAAGRAECV